MKNRAYSNTKQCFTCSFWTGQRNLAGGSLRNIVECEPNTKGDCLEGGIKRTYKMYNSTCSNWERWAQLRPVSNSEQPKNSSNRKKGTIPYPIFVALILLVGLIKFLKENPEVLIVAIIVILFVGVLSIYFYKKFKKQRNTNLQNNDDLDSNTIAEEENNQE